MSEKGDLPQDTDSLPPNYASSDVFTDSPPPVSIKITHLKHSNIDIDNHKTLQHQNKLEIITTTSKTIISKIISPIGSSEVQKLGPDIAPFRPW